MCGFAGFTNPTSERYAEHFLKNMLYPIEHRGPDSNSTFINEKIAIGHYRLSIIDLEGGRQPRIDKDYGSYLVFNGEIYGYKKHAKLLTDNGIFLKDKSDTEVLFQLLKIYGVEKTLKTIDGMFSFVYFEPKSDTLWLARDPMGEKPLYYSLQNNKTYFASELSSLVNSSTNTKLKIDESSLLSYLHLDYVPNENTILSNIKKVLPGQVIKIKKGELSKFFYFKMNYNNKTNIERTNAINQLDNLLENSVKERMVADVPLGIFLSGGIDSSLIAYYAKKNKKNIKRLSS